MFSLKTHAVITGGLFATIVAMAAVGNVLHNRGWLPDSSANRFAAQVILLGLFLVFGFSCIPLMLKLFIAGQMAIGNGDVGIIRAVAAHQTGIIFCFWQFLGLGLAIAIPAAIQDGFLGPVPAAALGPSQGKLIATPGMSVDDMQRLSSLKIKRSPDSVFADGGVFDITLGDTGFTISGIRFYYITTSRTARTST